MTECHGLGVNCSQPWRTEALDPGVVRCPPPEGFVLLGLGMVIFSLWSSICMDLCLNLFLQEQSYCLGPTLTATL